MGATLELGFCDLGLVHKHSVILPSFSTGNRSKYVSILDLSMQQTPWYAGVTNCFCIRNYAICVGAFIAAFALVWWLVAARG